MPKPHLLRVPVSGGWLRRARAVPPICTLGVSGRVVRVGVQIGMIWGAGGGRRLGMADPVAFRWE
jgi:hypothetical protein